MDEKIKLPKKVAKDIEFIKSFAKWTDREIIAAKAKEDAPFNGAYSGLNECDFDTLLRALVNGYEVEKTPEEEVRELYRGYIEAGHQSEAAAIRAAFIRYGVRIEGVNDNYSEEASE
jgi:hypothetical protein